jgi:hypothetical protein
MRLLPFLTAAAILGAWPAVHAGDEQTASKSGEERISTLIEALGSDDYTLREQASEELTRIGLPAYSELARAAGHPDREVRYRAQRILGVVRQHDMRRRLEAFLSGKAVDDDDSLPGWRRFKSTYGDDSAARNLFVEMQRADPELLHALEVGPRVAADLVTQRTVQYQQVIQFGGEELSLGEIAATLFVAAEKDVELPMQSLTTIFSQCFQPGFRDAVSTGTRRAIPRQMLATLIEGSEDFAAYQAMNVAYQLNMPEGIVPALKILKREGADRQAHMAQYALMTVARLGDASHLPEIEKLLDDTSLVTRMQENQTVYDVQLRDAALAATVLLSKAELSDFFDIPEAQRTLDPQMIFFNARLIGFPSDEKRAAAFAKWEQHKATMAQGDGERSESAP